MTDSPLTPVEVALRKEVLRATRLAGAAALESARETGSQPLASVLADLLAESTGLAFCIGLEVGLSLSAKDADAGGALLAFYRDTILSGDSDAAQAQAPVVDRLIDALNASKEV